MYTYKVKVLIFSVLAVFIVGCSPVTINSPVDGAVYTTAPDFILEFTGGQPAALQLDLNGTNITGHFTLAETGGIATGSLILPYLQNGKNTFSVVEPSGGPIVNLYMDWAGPEVHVTQVTEGISTTIVGYLEDLTASLSLTINGTNVTLTDGGFTVDVPSADFYTFIATDTLNQISETTYAADTVDMDSTIGIRIEQSGMDFIVSDIAQRIAVEDMDTIASQIHSTGELLPLIGYELWGLGGSLGNNTNLNSTVITNSAEAELYIFGILPDLNLDLKVDLYVTLGGIEVPLTRVTLPIDAIAATVNTFNTTAKVLASAGSLSASVENMVLELNDIVLDANLFSAFATVDNSADSIASTTANLLKNILEPIIAQMMTDILPEEIQKFLDVIPEGIEFTVLNKTIKPIIDPESINTPLQGGAAGLELSLGSRIFAPVPESTALGSLYQGSGAIPQVSTTTPGGIPNQFGALISIDMVNQALTAAFESGMVNITLDVGTLGFSLGSGASAIGPDDEIRLATVALAPPTITLVDSPTDFAEFDMNDLKFELYLKKVGQPDFELLFDALVSVNSLANLTVESGLVFNNGLPEETSVLKINLGQNPSIDIAQVNADTAWNITLIDQLAKNFAPYVVPLISDVLAIPIPSVAGYGLNVGAVWIPDGNTSFLAFSGDLVAQ